MPLTFEQYQKLDAEGFTPEEIAGFEKRRSAEQSRPFLPNRQRVQEEIAQRPGSLETLGRTIKENISPLDLLTMNVSNPMALLKLAQPAIVAAGIPFQRAEAAIASPALEAQAGNFNPNGLALSALQGLTGGSQAQFGDLVRTTGFGGRVNEPLSALAGLLQSGAMGAGLVKGAQALAPKVAPVAAKVGQAVSHSAPVRFIKNVAKNIKNVKNPVQFSQRVRQTLFQSKKAVGDAFESGIQQLSEANPGKSVDLSEPFKFIKSAIDDVQNNPGLASEIKGALRKVRNPELAQTIQTLIDDPSKASKLTLAQSQEIKGIIQQATSLGKMKQGGFAQWKPGDLELLDLVDEIKLAQSEAFPEMAQVREPYAKYMSNYREVKNMFKPRALLDKMRTGFGNEEIEAMIKAVLPDDTYKAIRGFKRADLIRRNAPKAAGLLIGAEGVRRVINTLTNR